VSFAATNLCLTSERVLIVLTDLRYVCFKLGELQGKRMKCSEQFSVIVPCGEDTFEWFS